MKYTLDPAEYWRLRYLAAETRAVQAETRLAVLKVASQQDEAVRTLAATYGFDPTVDTFQLEDKTLELIVPDST